MFSLLFNNDAEWKKASVRFLDDDILDDNYLINLKAAVVEFASWKHNGDMQTFEKTLREMHIKLIGIEEAKQYKGITAKQMNDDSYNIEMFPGVFRHELPYESNPIYYIPGAKFEEQIDDKLSTIRRIYYGRNKHYSEDEAVRVENIDYWNSVRVGYLMKYDEYEVKYPKFIHVPFYIERIKAVMRKIIQLDNVSNNDLNVLIPLLADYIHLWITGHIFQRGNFSLGMAQVNFILKNHGYETINHEYLDELGLLNSKEQFRKIFKSMVMKHQDLGN